MRTLKVDKTASTQDSSATQGELPAGRCAGRQNTRADATAERRLLKQQYFGRAPAIYMPDAHFPTIGSFGVTRKQNPTGKEIADGL